LANTAASGVQPVAERVGIVIVHGVLPHPRYEIQDLCAEQLANALGDDWTYSVVDLPDASVATTRDPRSSISRVRHVGDDADAPGQPFFDVIEAYWSPLDKGKATFVGILAWLVRTVFVPLNTTARYMSSRGKTVFDAGLIVAGMVLVIAALLGALLAAVFGYGVLLPTAAPDFWMSIEALLTEPRTLLTALNPSALAALAYGLSGAFLLVQALKAALGMLDPAQRNAARRRPAQRRERSLLLWGVGIAGALILASMPVLPGLRGVPVWAPLVFVLAGFLFEVGRTTAKSFFVNFFADVMIYTTRDENVDFFGMRSKMLDLVTGVIVNTALASCGGGKHYDRVFVLGHSLGSTIALDAVLRFAKVVQQAPEDALLGEAFGRIRGFVTFGSPLEKTKYFFDVNHPSPSLSFEQWRGDTYGRYFTDDPTVLDRPNEAPIFWGNYWYFADPVANELDSYRSFLPPGASLARGHHLRRQLRDRLSADGDGGRVQPGFGAIGRRVARNEQGTRGLEFPAVVPHGDYLTDGWFWNSDAPRGHLGVLDVVARTRASAARVFAPVGPPVVTSSNGLTFVPVPLAEAEKHPEVLNWDGKQNNRAKASAGLTP
jgi:pimeloyl-ACP methyl ester carboxylesterase